MTQEDKELLLKDLLGRVLYGVKVDYHGNIFTLGYNLYLNNSDVAFENYPMLSFLENIESVKPYLRPLSSMTEKEVQEIRDRLNNISIGRTITKENFEKCCDFLWFTKMSSFECVSEKMMDVVINYLDENMFDHRGFIEKGLALLAPEGMYDNNSN